jgi:hypothetical protein
VQDRETSTRRQYAGLPRANSGEMIP